MKRKIIITSIIIVILIVSAVIAIFILTNQPKQTSNKEYNETVDLTKDAQITNYKIDKVTLKETKDKTKMTFNITNTSNKTLNDETLYIVFKDKNNNPINALPVNIKQISEKNQHMYIELLFDTSLMDNKTKKIEYTTEEPKI